jgi:hypothetical protein
MVSHFRSDSDEEEEEDESCDSLDEDERAQALALGKLLLRRYSVPPILHTAMI